MDTEQYIRDALGALARSKQNMDSSVMAARLSLRRALDAIEAERLKEVDHDCHASPEDGCDNIVHQLEERGCEALASYARLDGISQ